MAVTQEDVLRDVAVHGESRANEIQARLTARTGREVNFGVIFTYLDRLTRADDLVYRQGDPDTNGRRPRLYRITDSGRRCLVAAAQPAHTESSPFPGAEPLPQA